MSEAIIKGLAVACELTNTVLSEAAASALLDELTPYSESQVLGALRKCCKEIKGRVTLADILGRLDDGRPGVEEAWAILSTILRNEQATIVWTEEIREAYGVVAHLGNDPVAARMAFKERYTALVNHAREQHEPVKWSASLGYDLTQREAAVREAVKRKRLTQEQALKLCPSLPPVSVETMKLIGDGDDLSAMTRSQAMFEHKAGAPHAGRA